MAWSERLCRVQGLPAQSVGGWQIITRPECSKVAWNLCISRNRERWTFAALSPSH